MVRLSYRYEAGLKRAVAVEVTGLSNQHEFNGVAALRQVLGEQRRSWDAIPWHILRDDGDHARETHGLTWYDSRENHPTRSEWRLYYTGLEGRQTLIAPGDLIVLLRREDGQLVLVSASAHSTWESQIITIFGVPSDLGGRFVSASLEQVDALYGSVASELFEAIGWVEEPGPPAESDDVRAVLERFGTTFPTSAEFSEFARAHAGPESSDPDETLCRWWSREESLFRALEKEIIGERVTDGFGSVDDFLSYSLSVQNRRKARAGLAFENHLEALFRSYRLQFDRGARTEGTRRPDFLFPGIDAYRDASFDGALLTMLGAKTTCKDRWRQVLTEAHRIPGKHLATLEPAISVAQLLEMAEHSLTVVAPRMVLASYTVPTDLVVLSVGDFVSLVRARER